MNLLGAQIANAKNNFSQETSGYVCTRIKLRIYSTVVVVPPNGPSFHIEIYGKVRMETGTQEN